MCLVVPAARARPAAAASKKKKKKKKGGGEGGEGDAGAGEDGADKMDTLALSQHIASLSVARNAQEQQRSDFAHTAGKIFDASDADGAGAPPAPP